jgi:hypothetical protein
MDVPDLNMSPQDDQDEPEAQDEPVVKFTDYVFGYSNCECLQCIMHNLPSAHHNAK